MALNHKPAYLVVLYTGQSIPLNDLPVTVGRRDDAMNIPGPNMSFISLSDRTVNRMHAIIDHKNEEYTIEDLNSLNRTRLNSIRLTPHQKYALHDGDILRFGSVEVRFEL